MKLGSVILALALALSGCGGASAWQKPAANTTCGDWLNEMSDGQRIEMTGTLFHSAMLSMGVDPALLTDDAINDELVVSLRDRLTDACGQEAQVAALPGVMDRVIAAEIESILQDIGDAISPPSSAL